MEKRWASVKLCQARVGVDCSDVTFRLNLWPDRIKKDSFNGQSDICFRVLHRYI